jgi:CRP/FNR family transcriptional regulator, anaerobic regulatory protein
MGRLKKIGERSDCPPACKDCSLRQTSAFSPATTAQVRYVESLRSDKIGFSAGSQVIPEHQRAPALYTLYSGWAFRYKTLSDGRRQILNFLLPGDFLGLQEQFSDAPTHGVDSLTDITLCVFPLKKLWDLYREHSALAFSVTWLAAREETFVDENLLSTGRRSASERIAALLLHLHRRATHLGLNTGGSIEFPLTQSHIADALGLSLVHTNRSLRTLHRAGLHHIEGGRLSILAPKALERLSEYYDQPIRQVPLI